MEACGNGLVHQAHVFGVVEVDHDRDRRPARNCERAQTDRLEPAVIGDAVLADLEGHGQAGALGAGDDRLGVLEENHVEGTKPSSGRSRLADEIDR